MSTKRKPTKKLSDLPSDIILIITGFLNYSDQLRLSHVSKAFRGCVNEEFWRKQISEREYLIWDDSLPMAKLFFTNYFYHRGFGRDPKLPEKVVAKIEDVTFLPDIEFAEKALTLGFPKGQENYRQVQHKKNMLMIARAHEKNSSIMETIQNQGIRVLFS